MNVREIFQRAAGLRIKSIRLDFGTDLDLDLEPGINFFRFSIIERFRHYVYDLKDLRMNVYDMFCRV